MIDHWLDAIGDKNPIYVDEAAAKEAGHRASLPHRQ
jgi:acyl dehydratase